MPEPVATRVTLGQAPVACGRVAFVGAGPGDPGLMTVRSRELLGMADVVVLDDLGAELTSCPSGSALASQRIERSVKILHARHNAGRKTVLTMGMPLARVDEVYGAGVLGRVVDEKRSAAHVDLGGMS